MKKGLTVLSICDGISCGKVALERAGIKINKYIASEIKKSAIKCSKENHSDILYIGDVTKVKYENGILYYDGGEIETKIDIIIGGTPCQSFSMGANFSDVPKDLDGKSKLFLEYLRLLKEIEPEYFLLENVKMRKDSKKILDDYLGVEGLFINSSLLSFQKRPRYYWTNIPNVTVPEDKKINFQDYKETDYEECIKYKLNPTKTRIRMWNDGKGRVAAFKGDNTSKYSANVTNAEKVECLTRKQDRSPNSGLIEFDGFCRYLTRKEIELAQTLPIGYTDCLSYNQMQDVCGDGWTIDVIAHIFSFLPNTYKFDELHTYNDAPLYDMIHIEKQDDINGEIML